MGVLEFRITDRIASIILNRQGKRNALNPQLIELLTTAFRKAIDDDTVKLIILKANGDVFSAGADLEYLKHLQNNSPDEDLKDSNALKELFLMIYRAPKLVIAQVEGHAIAGGCGLISVCDLVFSIPEAKFGYTEVKIGFIPALVSCFLIRKLGEGRAKELLLSGLLIDAKTASAYGLINFIVEKHEIESKVWAYGLDFIKSVSTNSVALSKSLINAAQDLSLDKSLDLALKLNVETRASADCKRGISAFLNKEKLEW